jgi:ATP-dependent RNA circularization protein (DNA/RNA ligase family)
MSKGIRWTKEEKQFLIENYGVLSVRQISRMMGKTPKQIYDYASLLRSQGKNILSLKDEQYKKKIYGE